MPNATFRDLSPSAQLRQLGELERSDSDELPGHLDAFGERLRAIPVAELLELLAQAAGEDGHGYWRCVSALHARPEPAVLAACATWAASAEPRLRKAAANVSAQLGYRQGHPFAERSRPLLEALLADCEPGVVEAALVALGHLGIGDLQRIIACAGSRETDVRRAAVHALLARDELPARRALIELSRDADLEVRDWATFALGSGSKTDDPEIREALVARLEDEDGETRGEALMGLAARKDPRAVPAILAELAREDVEQLAIEAAARMPHASFRPGLEALLRESPDDETIREAWAACRDAGA